MDKHYQSFRSNYLHHESVYAAHPEANGWNDAVVDQKILSYVHELVQQAHLTAPASILELGCGMGNLSIPLAQTGFQVAGIDISRTAIEVATQRALVAHVPARFYAGDVTRRETFRDIGRFDCVLDGLCWHCIVGADRAALLACIRETVTPSGCFLVMTMTGKPRSAYLEALFDPRSRYLTSGQIADRYLGQPQDLAQELVLAGFDVVYQRVVEGDDETGDQDMFLAVATAHKEQ